MRIRHVHGDIITAPLGYALVQAIALDCRTSAGLAKYLEDHFHMRSELLARRTACVPQIIAVRRRSRLILNVVTKTVSHRKPNPLAVKNALALLKSYVVAKNIMCLAFPKFSCGLDKLPFPQFLEYLHEIFGNLPIDILIYHVR
jgi:hypothetical protein